MCDTPALSINTDSNQMRALNVVPVLKRERVDPEVAEPAVDFNANFFRAARRLGPGGGRVAQNPTGMLPMGNVKFQR